MCKELAGHVGERSAAVVTSGEAIVDSGTDEL